MPTTYKVLAQAAPSSTSTADLYTVPAATQTVVSTLVVCNRAAANASYNIAIRPAAATLSNQHYIAFNTAIPANDSITLTIGMTLGNTDVVTIQANTIGVNNLGFTLFGSEVT